MKSQSVNQFFLFLEHAKIVFSDCFLFRHIAAGSAKLILLFFLASTQEFCYNER